MKTFLRLVSVAALATIAGCNLPQPQADTVRHFTLAEATGATPVENATQVRIVQVAGHLHQRSLAVRIAEHEVMYVEDFRWAEPLDASITQILRQKLDSIASGAIVSVEVERCEPVRYDGNKVEVVATWSISAPGLGHGAVRQGVFTSTPRTWDGKDFGALVTQMQQAIGELGDAIAAALPAKDK